uniref:Uncharacterized protein n=1 Tax=Manihot esculenta TaxID=3983 RepID=A0A2C9UGT9_MANES
MLFRSLDIDDEIESLMMKIHYSRYKLEDLTSIPLANSGDDASESGANKLMKKIITPFVT